MLLLLVILGIAAGIIAGFFGVGGGILFSPILFFLFTAVDLPSPVTWTVATALFCTFVAAISSSIQQRQNRNIYWKEGVIIGILGAIGIYVGKRIVLSSFYTETVFVSFFVVLLLFVAYMFYQRSRSKLEVGESTKELRMIKRVNTGFFGGLVAAMAGVGGGVVMVPTMNLLYKLPIAKAVSISSLAIVIISLSGWVQYALFVEPVQGMTSYTVGYVDFGTSLPLVGGAFAGGVAGVKINKIVKGENVQKGFSVLVIVIAIALILSLF